ncbi:MAG TPA: MFS transporter [Burkholderiaceae bacterium]|jgi:predicted MFS family arabinose efflux permease
MGTQHVRVVAALGSAQTLAWASSYYLPAMLAPSMARDLGVSVPTVFAAFSGALVVSAMLGPLSGRMIDRWGGRPVLMGTSLVFALGLALLGHASSAISMVAAWWVMGVAMGSGLYEAAFSALVRLYGRDARNAIRGITLIAGFASTVGWPLTTWMNLELGWRGACWGWAGLHLLIGLPLNALLPRIALQSAADEQPAAESKPPDAAPPSRRSALLLSFVFAVTWFVSTAMAAHLPRVLEAAGVGLTGAVAIAALVGPSQVAGRLLEFWLMRHVHPLLSARVAALAHPLGAVLLLMAGGPVAAVFAVLHGAGNGVLTIAKGTLPLALFGPQGYGRLQGMMAFPARLAQALSPWLFGLLLADYGLNALLFSAAACLVALAALMAIPSPAAEAAQPPSQPATPT